MTTSIGRTSCNAQKKDCYAARAAATFLRLIFCSPLRFTKNGYANAPMQALPTPLGRSAISRLATVAMQ